MNTPSEEPTLHELLSRLAELEQAHARLQAELTNVRAERATAAEQTSTQTPTRTRPRRSSRRKVLTKGLGVAVASVGAGTLLELSGGTALAAGAKPGVFASSVSGTPAVSATGTNGADGVGATSDSGTGVSATSGSGTGLVAKSSSGLAGHFVGNVKLDNALTVVGTLSSGAGALASSVSGTPAVKATGTNGAGGVDATSDSGDAVFGTSSGGVGVTGHSISSVGVVGVSDSGDGVEGGSSTNDGVLGVSSSSTVSVAGVHGINARPTSGGLAGLFDGNVQVNGNFTATGTLSSGAGALASSVSGTPAVKATGTNGADGVDASSDSGDGVRGSSSGANGSGVFGINTSGTGIGVFGTGVTGVGVEGSSDSNIGVLGASNSGDGVFGESGSGNAVHARSFGTALAGLFDGDVHVNGNFLATGTKNFVQAHPTDPSWEIVYVALEGGEAGTYVRGSGTLQSGKAVLALPEHFGLVTAEENLAIQLTPRGEWLQLYVVELDATQAVVREAQGKSGAFDYFISGVRRGYEQHEVLRTKR